MMSPFCILTTMNSLYCKLRKISGNELFDQENEVKSIGSPKKREIRAVGVLQGKLEVFPVTGGILKGKTLHLNSKTTFTVCSESNLCYVVQ